MIKAQIDKCDWAAKCSNPTCERSPKYHDHIIGDNYLIKRGSICLVFYLNGEEEVYCRECIDIVYKKLKPVLDSKLWVFN